jgi:uracil-DNA glycosylase
MDDDAREELATLIGGVRSLLEDYADTGATEIPGDVRAVRAFEEEASQRFALPKRATEQARPGPGQRSEVAPAPARAPASAPAPAPASASAPANAPAPAPAPARAPEKSGLDPIARRVRLEQIAKDVAACVRCPLHAARTQTVFARGNPESDLMFVGEGPGAEEDAQGLPFVGKAGQLLDKMIVAMGYQPDDVYVANIVKCRPPSNRKPEPAEMEACEGFLHEQIALVEPKVIVALGATAVEGLLKTSGITRLRGTWRLYRGQIPVMPTFHPAYLLRQPQDKRLVWSDLQQVMKKLGKSP